MIVRPFDDHVLVITQPDHALLAATIMQHCVDLAKHPRRATIMYAIRHHDGGWAVEDATPRVDPASGEVLDFIHAAAEVRQGVWPRGIELVEHHDPYAAALIAQHALTVYDRLRSAGEWEPFFEEITRRRDNLVARCDVGLDQVVADYAFVRLGDLISLTVCTDAMERSGFGGWEVHRTPGGAVVEPDVFGGDVVRVSIVARELTSRTFPSDAALQEAFAVAPEFLIQAVVGAA